MFLFPATSGNGRFFRSSTRPRIFSAIRQIRTFSMPEIMVEFGARNEPLSRSVRCFRRGCRKWRCCSRGCRSRRSCGGGRGSGWCLRRRLDYCCLQRGCRKGGRSCRCRGSRCFDRCGSGDCCAMDGGGSGCIGGSRFSSCGTRSLSCRSGCCSSWGWCRGCGSSCCLLYTSDAADE